MVELAHKFEEALLEKENANASSKTPPGRSPNRPTQDSISDPQSSENQSNGQAQPSEVNRSPYTSTSLARVHQQGAEESQEEGENQSFEVELESNGSRPNDEQLEKRKAEMESVAEEIVSKFEEEMAPVMDSLQKAKNAFHDLDELLDEDKGFDQSSGIWKRSGWQQMERLRRKLEDLKELRDLVRDLGRSGGRGPKRKAPAQV